MTTLRPSWLLSSSPLPFFSSTEGFSSSAWTSALRFFPPRPTNTHAQFCVWLFLEFVPPYLIYPVLLSMTQNSIRPHNTEWKISKNINKTEETVACTRSYNWGLKGVSLVAACQKVKFKFTIKRPVMHNVQVKYVGKRSQFPKRKNTCSSSIYLILCK